MSHDFQTGCDKYLYDWEGNECQECGKDLATQDEIERGVCDDCNQEDTYEEYLKYGVSLGEKEANDE